MTTCNCRDRKVLRVRRLRDLAVTTMTCMSSTALLAIWHNLRRSDWSEHRDCQYVQGCRWAKAGSQFCHALVILDKDRSTWVIRRIGCSFCMSTKLEFTASSPSATEIRTCHVTAMGALG